MKDRVKRHLAIRKIISGGGISSQEDLLHKLKSKGFSLTQATLSRDLKVLQVAKIPDREKSYIYVIPELTRGNSNSETSMVNFLADGFKGIQFSGSLAVVKTIPGYASSIASVIDSANSWEILGTIAGDDTILIVLKEGVSKRDVINGLILIMPSLKEKIGQ
ncbi:MAG: arginine repressor [Chlorobi bacterium]|nr:arginine repressor [Chlorobiota bacterium]